MKKNSFIILFLVFSIATIAQQKHLTVESGFLGGLYPERMWMLQWVGDTDTYVYWDNTAYQIKDATGNTVRKIDLSELQSTYPDLKRLPFFDQITPDQIVFQRGDSYVVYNYVTQKEVTKINLDEQASHQDFCLKNNMLAYTIANNLYVADASNPKQAVTDNSDKNIVSGQSIHRNEFGISKGIFWSPNGNFLAFYQKDETNVTEYPLVDITTYPATLNNIKYPMAGQGSEKAKVGIYNVKNKQVTYLNIDTSDEHYLTNLAWTPDEKYITLAELNRGQDHLWFNVYDATTGEKIKTVFEETNAKWVEPEFPALFLPNSDSTFLWISEKDGFMNVYQYDLWNNSSIQITNFDFVVTQITGFDPKAENVFVEATGEDPKGLKLFKVNLKKGTVTDLTKEKGTHHAQINASGNYLLDAYTNLTTPNVTSLVDLKKNKTTVLLNAKNPLKEYQLGTSEFVKLKAEDGQDLEAIITKPYNFDPAKKYPVLIYVYGGTHAQLVTDTWLGGTGLWMQYLAAEKDYIVFTLDNRGSGNRSFAFESVIHRQQGKPNVADQMVGVEYLKSLPYVDANRIAVNGWSYGGFMTISLLLDYPDAFKVGVAGGPVTDWKYYEVMYGERYMDTPQENPEGYESTRVHGKIGNLKSDLLIIHGSIDDTVVPQHSMTLLKEAVEKGVQVDFFTYTMHPHNVRGKDRVHLFTKIIDYILEKNK